jgi:membrane dipeptidase
MSPSARRTCIDGLVYFSDGDPAPLAEGGVTAANVTVVDMHADASRALEQMGAWLGRVAAPSSGWRLVRRASDIEAARDEGRVGLVMGWQNALPLGDRLERVRAFHAIGLRVLQLAYNEANLVADGCMEPRQGGLTAFGRELVGELCAVGVAIDLSHCSEATGREAAALSTRPVFVTHANARALDARVRNKSDETLRAVADGGGVIGISVHGFLNWNGRADSPPSLENFVRHVRHVVDLCGIGHVGIGTDFSAVRDDATVQAILDMSRDRYAKSGGEYAAAFGNASAARYPAETPTPRQWQRLPEALERGGFRGGEIDAIAGGNFLRALRDAWGG